MARTKRPATSTPILVNVRLGYTRPRRSVFGAVLNPVSQRRISAWSACADMPSSRTTVAFTGIDRPWILPVDHGYWIDFPASTEQLGGLSGGEQRMLTLARVLVLRPRLLIADELSLGLAPIIVDEVYRSLAAIRDTGTAILLVEQYVGHALGLADDVVVLAKGAVAHAGPAAELGDISQYVL